MTPETEAVIAELVAQAPPLTPGQIATLRGLLNSGTTGADASNCNPRGKPGALLAERKAA
jgi:hypothetical protein